NAAGGVGSLNKLSFGTLTLSGYNAYTGGTNIKNGTMVLNFADTAATTPVTNIINSASALSFGGANARLGDTSYARLIMTGKASTNNSQSFVGTTLDVGPANIQVTSGTTGSATLNMGLISRVPGAMLDFVGTPASGAINTTTGNVNGILGGWATI